MSNLKHTLLMAQGEILQLRRENELLRAKVETMELLGQMLRTIPYSPSMTMGEDVAWRLQQAADEIPDPPKS